MLEDFLVAFKNFSLHKLRTTLSLLGIIVGIMAVVIITTLGSSLYGSLTYTLKENSSSSTNMCNIYPQYNSDTQQMAFKADEKYRQGLYKVSNKITKIFYTNELSVAVIKGSAELNEMFQWQTLTGIEPEWTTYKKIELSSGSFFNLSDWAENRQCAIIGHTLARKLFPEGNCIDKKFMVTIKTYSRPNAKPLVFYFTVKGITKPKNTNNEYLANDMSILVPRTFLTKLTNTKEANTIELFMQSENDYPILKEQVLAYSDNFANFENAAYVYGISENMDAINQVLNIVQLILSAIAFISLIVGGINISNIMIATVTERKREIAIRKALGATQKNITIQFLIETITLTITGGILGAALGLFISFAIICLIPAEALGLQNSLIFIINTTGLMLSFSVSILVGIFFGILPARKAAKLDPVICLS